MKISWNKVSTLGSLNPFSSFTDRNNSIVISVVLNVKWLFPAASTRKFRYNCSTPGERASRPALMAPCLILNLKDFTVGNCLQWNVLNTHNGTVDFLLSWLNQEWDLVSICRDHDRWYWNRCNCCASKSTIKSS